MRGLGCLMVIDAVMTEIKKRTRKAVLPCEVFDLICGTSIGGLIAILLGRLGLDCQTAIEVYEKTVKTLFKGNRDVWDIVANGEHLETSYFESYMGQIVAQVAGGATVSIKENLDPLMHPRTKVRVAVLYKSNGIHWYRNVGFRDDNGGSSKFHTRCQRL
jgi:hypothetical protein